MIQSISVDANCFVKDEHLITYPPTNGALIQHLKRAAFIAGYVWSRSLRAMMHLPHFKNFGYTEDGMPYWTDLPEASLGVRKLIKCGCVMGCKGKCHKVSLKCTELCACNGSCKR